MRRSIRRRAIGWLAVAGTTLALLGAGCEAENGNGLDGLNGADDTAPAPAEPNGID